MITLKVPEGTCCKGCTFLEIDYRHNFPRCLLFNEEQDYLIAFGNIDVPSIIKISTCPTEEA